MAILFVISVVIVFAVIAATYAPKPLEIKDQTVLIWNLGTAVTDGPEDPDPIQTILSRAQGGESTSSISVRDLVAVIDDAARDRRISSLLIRGDFRSNGIRLAHLRELIAAVERFQATGKPVYAHLNNDGMSEILVKSIADVITIEPTAILDFRGLGVTQLFFGEALKELKIDVHTVNIGDFKSFTDVFTNTEMSEPERVQLREVLTERWELYLELLGTRETVKVDALLAHMQEHPFIQAEEAVAMGIAQEIRPYLRVVDELRQRFEVDDEGTGYRRISAVAYRDRDPDALTVIANIMENKPHVAVVYAEGPIVEGFGRSGEVGGRSLSSTLHDLRMDTNVKAVVLRINSPGGSAFASEQILNELVHLNERKPVIVSMGPVAASGGYYIASRADRIFADPFTITGSIGVAGVVFGPHRLLNDFGLHTDTVRLAPFADMGNIGRPWSEQELLALQRFTAIVYDDFLRHVAEGRGISKEEALALAGGRIYGGKRALELGLVDQLGGLQDAIDHAARTSRLGDQFDVVEYPRRRSFEERLRELFQVSGASWLSRIAGGVPGLESKALQVHQDIGWMLTNPDQRNVYILDLRANSIQ